MKKVVVFGTGEQAQLGHYYLTNDSDHKVAAFTVDGAFLNEKRFLDLPVVGFETVEKIYPPGDFEMFVAVGYSEVNSLRARKCEEARKKGYRLASYVSSKATLWSREMGDNCFILEDNTIQPFVKIGNNVTLWSGNHIGHHSVIGDNCFITSHVVVSGGVQMGKNCFVGVNATIRDHVKIADYTVIGAATLILGDTQENGVYTGNPSKLSDVPSHRLKKI